MLGRMYESQDCSAARALEVVGERWSLLIIRDAMFGGITKFSDFERNLGIAPNVLASRLDGFVAVGLMQLCRYSDQAGHHEYVLTEKGMDLQPVIIALTAWGDRWAAPDGPPIVYAHDECGGPVGLRLRCESCGVVVKPGQVQAHSRSESRSTNIVPKREVESVATAEGAHSRIVPEVAGRGIGRPVAHSAEAMAQARLLRARGASYGKISAETGIPKTSLHRYLAQQ
jgi:DNA-binding HxlR family transcriptional regulator